MTETNMILSNPYRGERRPGAVGLPLPGVEVRAVPSSSGAQCGQLHILLQQRSLTPMCNPSSPF